MKQKYPSFFDWFKEHFSVVCKKCGSTDVYTDFEPDGGYSEYTQWGATFSCRCASCNNEVTNYDKFETKN